MTTYSGHDELLSHLRTAVNRDQGRLRRRRRVALASVGVVLVTAATVAAATGLPWWESAAPPVNPKVVDRQLAPQIGTDFPPTADRSRARTVAEINGATLVAAPVGKTGYCLIPALPGHADLGFSCEYQQSDEVRTYAQPASQGTPRWIIYGRFNNPNAATVDLSAAVGTSLRVQLQPGGFFIADVPSSRWDALANGAGPATVLDSSGATLATVCLDWGPSPGSPGAGETRTPSDLGQPPCKAPVQIAVKPDFAQATKLVETTLAYDFSIWKAGTTIALWKAPDQGGGWCLVLGPVPLPASGAGAGAEQCGPTTGSPPPGHPLNVSFSSGLAHGMYRHLLQGSVDPSSGIVKVELQTADGTTRLLDFANGYFLDNVAPTNSVRLDGAFVVGYDASGKEVARAAVSPHG